MRRPTLLPRFLTAPGRRAAWRRAVARRLLAAALAGVAVLAVVAALRPPPPAPEAALLVAARTLPAGHLLTAADLRQQAWPAQLRPAAATSSTSTLVGRRLAGPVAAGEPLTSLRLLGPGLLDAQPVGHVAAHVPLADPAAARMARPGDRVDLLSATGGTVAGDVPVLAIDASPEAQGWAVSGAESTVSGIVVAVSRAQAAALARASGGDPAETGPMGLTLVLRSAAGGG